MLLHIQPNDDRPIYAQIVDQIKDAVASGLLKSDELVPSVRELSRQLVVNPNTVARAYRQLQTEGVLHALRGTGLAVNQASDRRCRQERSRAVRHRIRIVLAHAARSGLSIAKIRRLVGLELDRLENRLAAAEKTS